MKLRQGFITDHGSDRKIPEASITTLWVWSERDSRQEAVWLWLKWEDIQVRRRSAPCGHLGDQILPGLSGWAERRGRRLPGPLNIPAQGTPPSQPARCPLAGLPTPPSHCLSLLVLIVRKLRLKLNISFRNKLCFPFHVKIKDLLHDLWIMGMFYTHMPPPRLFSMKLL